MSKSEGVPIINMNALSGDAPKASQLKKELAELRSGNTTPDQEKRVDEISEQLKMLRKDRDAVTAENLAELTKRQAETRGGYEEDRKRA